MKKYQYPNLSYTQAKLVRKLKNSKILSWCVPILEWLFAAKMWRHFYMASLKRSARMFSEKFSHFSHKGHIDLPDDFIFIEEIAVPRNLTTADGKHYSYTYEIELNKLPKEILDLALSYRQIIESYFACETRIRNAQLWRNFHLPSDIVKSEIEVYSDAFHQDLVVD